MSVIRMTAFGGMVPKMDPRALPLGAAVQAINCKLYSGALDSFYAPLKRATISTGAPKDFYVFEDAGVTKYAALADFSDVVRAPLLNDAFDRIYYTDPTGIYITTRPDLAAGNVPANRLGVPVPDTPSFVVLPNGGTTVYAETRVYALTIQSLYGEESAPGAFVTVSGNTDGTWTLNGLDSYVAAVGYPAFLTLSIYRTITTSSGVSFYKVAYFSLNNLPATYSDSMTDDVAAQQSILISVRWATPTSGMLGLVLSPNGFLAAFKGRTVYFSEPYYPHAWPQQYQLAVEDDVVGLGSLGNAIVVCTKGRPYIIVGTTPGQQTLQRINDPWPCLSKRSIVSMGAQVMFASYKGIVSVSDSGIEVITGGMVDTDTWNAQYSPANIFATSYSGRYYGWYSPTQAFVLDPTTRKHPWTEIAYGTVIAAHQSYVDGTLQMLVGGDVYEWDADTSNRLPYTWQSSEMLIAKPENMSVVVVRADFTGNPSITFTLTTDRVVRGMRSVGTLLAVRLPRGYKASNYSFTLSGTTRVFSVTLASSGPELALAP